MSRIGVFICHCGTNISATVDVEKVGEAAAKHLLAQIAGEETGVGSETLPSQLIIGESCKDLTKA